MLVGLALGDEAMIRERLNTREAGDLLDEINAHRLRVNYGPHLVRVTRQDMQTWMPEVRPAQPLALEADAALAELLDAIRRGGREAYRRLLELLRELRDLEPGSRLFTSRRWPSSRASKASSSATSASTSTPPSTPRRSRTPRPRSPRRSAAKGSWPTRCAAAATGCRCCAA